MSDSGTTALILCAHPESQTTIDHVFGQHNIKSHIALTSWAARKMMMEREFDLMIVDFDEPEAAEMVDAWCQRGPNSSKVVIVMGTSSETLKLARQKHCHFVMQKPLNGLVIVRTLKIAFSVLMKKRRADIRQTANVKTLAILRDGNATKDFPLTLVDISMGGACVKSNALLPLQKQLDLAFRLEEGGELIQLTGKVVWCEPNGFAGVRFTAVPPKAAKALNRWMDSSDLAGVVPVVTSQEQSQGQVRAVYRI